MADCIIKHPTTSYRTLIMPEPALTHALFLYISIISLVSHHIQEAQDRFLTPLTARVQHYLTSNYSFSYVPFIPQYNTIVLPQPPSLASPECRI